MSDDGGMVIEKLFRLWRRAFGDQPLTLKKLFGLITNNRDNPEASKNTRRVFRQYLKDCGIFDVAGPREKLGIFLSKHLGRHGNYELSRVRNIHQGAWQWSVMYRATNAPTPEQIKQTKCFVLVPCGACRFSHEPTAKTCEQKVRALGYTADVVFHRNGGYAVRLYDVDLAEAKFIAKQLLRKIVEIKNLLKRDGEKTVIEGPDLPAIGYFPEAKFLRRAFVEDYERAGAAIRSYTFLNFEWSVFD